MPLYNAFNVLQVRGINAFFKLEAGVTRGPVPDSNQDIARLRRMLSEKDRELEALQEQARKQRFEAGTITIGQVRQDAESGAPASAMGSSPVILPDETTYTRSLMPSTSGSSDEIMMMLMPCSTSRVMIV